MKKMMRYVMQFMICLVISGAMLVGTGQTVFAVTTLPAESDTASEGCVLLGERGDFYSNAQEAIDRINEIRYEACTTGVKDPRNTSRTLTEEDYVPIEWSQALELIARLRAAETVPAVAMNGKIGHFRTNGKSALTVYYGGIKSSAEDIAWNSGTGMMGGIEQWYKEKEYWDNNTEGKETGHYTSMINPSYRYVGLGAFKCYNSINGSSNVVVGELSGVCGNLGQEMLSPQMDIIQTIEVKESYITGYTFLGKGTLNTEQQCQYTPLAIGKLSSSSQNAGYFWLVDEYSLTVSDPDIASIDENNNVTAHKAGTFDISIHSGGEILHTQTITVRCNHDKVLLEKEDATCTATGTAHYHCDVCGKDFDETIAKKPHDYVFGEAGTDGKSTGVCSVCGDTVTVAIPTGIKYWWNNSSSGNNMYSTQFPSSNPVGFTLRYDCDLTGGETEDQQIVFESTDESVISSRIATSTSGSLAINGAGIAKLTVYPLYNKSLAKTYTLRAGAEGDVAISRATVSDVDSMPYTGSEKKPTVTVTYRGVTLSKGTDYTVAYEDNINAGQAKIIISGAGIFGGTAEKTFTIEPIQLTKSNVTLSQTSYECDGTAKEPAVTVKYNSKTLTAGEHYDVTYENNIRPGTATVTVTGKGNYAGTIVSEFTMTHSSHTYVEETTKEPTCTQDGTKTFTCSICGGSYTESIPALGHNYEDVPDSAVAATCDSPGKEADQKCSRCGHEETGAEIPALGHEWGEPIYTWADDYSSVTAERYCAHDINHEHAQIETAAVTSAVTEDSTCSKEGVMTYTSAEFPNEAFSVQTKTVAISLKEHTPAEPVDINYVDPTCTEAGHYDEVVYCEVCGAELTSEQKEIPATGHVDPLEYTAAKDPTCTEDGNTAYWYCPKCKNYFSDEAGQDVIAVNSWKIASPGHKWNEGEVTKAATCKETGTRKLTCTVCGATKEESIAVIPHDWQHVINKATLTTNGSEYDQCTACKAKKNIATIYRPGTFKLSATAYIYSGTVKKPTVTVKNSNNGTIAATNYTVTYSNNKYVGTAKVKIAFKNTTGAKYTGTKSLTFKINPKGTSLSKLTPKKKAFTVTWKKQATQTTGYQIQYSTSSKFASGNKLVTVAKIGTTSKTISKLKAKKRYYVRVRTYKTVSGVKYYSAWSAKKYVKTK